MKNKYLGLILILAIASGIGAGVVIKYRGGDVLSFDSTASLKDEDGSWTISNSQLGKLSRIQDGTALNHNQLTVTQTFSTVFLSTPKVVVTGDAVNEDVYVTSITTSNAILGSSVTNVTFEWLAIP